MKKTSIHFKACSIAASETHNKREKDLSYVRKELTHLNESYSFSGRTLKAEEAAIKKLVKEKTGRKLYKNAMPIKEGVIVIDEDTSLEDLKKFCYRCEDRFGIAPLQIHIHRDEGHVRSKEWKPNLHAHIVWGMYNRDGKNVRLSREDMAEIQTIAADSLGMERGKSSTAKHLSSLEYKNMMEELRTEELENQLEDLTHQISNKEKTKEVISGVKQGVSDLFTGKTKRKYDEAEKRAQRAENDLTEANKEIERLTAEKNSLKSKVNAAADFINKKAKTVKEIENERDLYKVKAQTFERKFKGILADAAKIGLSARQTNELFNERKLSVGSVTDKDGNQISRSDGKPIDLKLDTDGILVKFVSTWERVATWLRQAVSNTWFSVNRLSNSNDTKQKKSWFKL